MLKRTVKIVLTLTIAGVFLWLAFRNVKIEEVWEYARRINFSWVIPLAFTSLASHILRAERWRLLIEPDEKELDRITMISGVLVGYLLNLVGPRLGEVTRPVYVGRREGLSSSKLMGTIVLERIIDLATMGLLMLVVSIYLISDVSLLRKIFGEKTVTFFTTTPTLTSLLVITIFILLAAAGVYAVVKLSRLVGNRFEKAQYWITKIKQALKMFKKGLLSARRVERWWLFLTYTFLMWLGYTLMTYFPFWMFNMQEIYQLGMLDALVITVISAFGIAIPSPGGIGTYHYFVTQSLWILYLVPATNGITYAVITHAAMILLVCLFTPIFLFIDKLRASKAGKPIV